jgi:hypothetical protein
MQHIQSVAAGLLALLGSVASASELPVIKEAEASWRGCAYKLKVLDDSAAGSQSTYPIGPPWQTNGKYQITLEIVSGMRSLCRIQPRTVELSKAFEVPDLAITVNDAGLAVAYSRGAYHPWAGYLRVIEIRQFDPVNLSTLKATDLYARYGQNPDASDYAPGRLSLSEVTIHSTSIEVRGGVEGTQIWGGGTTRTGSGSQFIAGYLDFFGQPQQPPSIVIY